MPQLEIGSSRRSSVAQPISRKGSVPFALNESSGSPESGDAHSPSAIINNFVTKIVEGQVSSDALPLFIDHFLTFLTTSRLPLPFPMLRKLWLSDPSIIFKAFSEGRVDNSFLSADQKSFEEGLTLTVIEWQDSIPDKAKFLRKYLTPSTRSPPSIPPLRLPIEAVVITSYTDSVLIQEIVTLLVRLKIKITLSDLATIFAHYSISTVNLQPFFPLLNWEENGIFACLYAQSRRSRDDFLMKCLTAKQFGTFALRVSELAKPLWVALFDNDEPEMRRLFSFLETFSTPLPELLDPNSSMSYLAARSRLGMELVLKYRAIHFQ